MHRITIALAVLITLPAISEAGADPALSAPIEVAQRPLVSGERVQVQRLARDMESAMETLNQDGVAPFQDPEHGKRWERRVEQYRASLERYPQVDDADVRIAAQKLVELESMVAFAINEAARQQAELGDVQAILAGIEKALHAHPAPLWLPAPFDDEEALRWARDVAMAKLTAQRGIEEIQRIAPNVHLPLNPGTVQEGAPYDRHDLDRLINVASRTIRNVDEAIQQTVTNLQAQMEAQNRELDYFRALDPDNENHRMNAFLKEGAEAEVYGSLDTHLALAQSVAAYQRAFGQEPGAAATARIDEITALRQTYAANRVKAVGASRLPAPKSTDPQRIAIAEGILAEPRYEFGMHGPIVLTTADIVEREQQVSRAEIKNIDVSLSGDITLTGTETTWNYRWEEFRFATPIQEVNSDDWHVWWITAKKFSSGWEGTPIGRWVSGAATKGDLILEQNFSR